MRHGVSAEDVRRGDDGSRGEDVSGPAGRRGESKLTARRAAGALLGINPATLRNWVEREEIDTGARSGTTSNDAVELARLRKENAEPRKPGILRRRRLAFGSALHPAAWRTTRTG
jgi:transposase-like protein